ncbi:MAG TPA: V4R domain-containing protein [Gemmatimonadales bacterium]|nr:V4R domain-containing protein [Gemmatimonadales bacterium]
MNAPSLMVTHHCVPVGRRALHQLRASLERDTGLQSATYLQEAGFAGGEEVFNAFIPWLKSAHGIEHPRDLDARHFGEVISRFFAEAGWGSLASTRLTPAVLALDSTDWSEADAAAAATYPSCHLTSGMLADFFGRVAGGVVGVMEVECQSRGDARCRFLVGSPETLQTMYERMAQGQTYSQALGQPG